jgi:hypothetical protein
MCELLPSLSPNILAPALLLDTLRLSPRTQADEAEEEVLTRHPTKNSKNKILFNRFIHQIPSSPLFTKMSGAAKMAIRASKSSFQSKIPGLGRSLVSLNGTFCREWADD